MSDPRNPRSDRQDLAAVPSPRRTLDHGHGALDSRVRLALPSKGMETETLEFFAAAGLPIDRTNPRQYRASVRGLTGIEVVFQRAVDIFAKVDQGSLDLGVTGYDIISEQQYEDDNVVVLYQGLGYGQCELVLAVPEGWIDVATIADLAEIAADFRTRGRELHVATKYPNLTRQFLYDHAINYFSLAESSGAMEAAPAMGYADVVCDLMTSGVTLRENRLKTIEGGTLLHSEAALIGNRLSLARDPTKLEFARELLEPIEAHLRARDYLSLTANIRGESAEAVARLVTAHSDVAGLRGPTIASVFSKVGETDWFAVTVVVRASLLWRAIDCLRKAGASEITTLPLRYVFESKSWTFEALRRHLGEERRVRPPRGEASPVADHVREL